MLRFQRGPTLSALLCASVLALGPGAAFAKTFSLQDALAQASAGDPSLPADGARTAAAEAAVRKAGVGPGAALSLELENIAGTGAYSLLDRSETTLAYERPLERGGKAQARTGRARAELSVVRLRAQARRLDFLKTVQLAYADALAADADLLMADARLISARRARADVARRVKSARDPLFAGSRAQTAEAQALIARDQARDAARAAQEALSAYLAPGADVSISIEDFFNVAPVAAVPALAGPDLALLEAERDVAAAALRVAQAGDRADPTLRAGVRYFGEGSQVALMMGGSIPLGVRHANRSEVERAQAELSASELDIAAERLARERAAARLAAQLNALAAESDRIRDEVIPLAARAVDQVIAGFNRGGFEYIDVAEAERALADARARRVEVLRDYHKTKADLDRLTGAHSALAAISSETR